MTRRPPPPHGESFGAADPTISGGLEYPHYTRPRDYQGHTVPDILLSGTTARLKNGAGNKQRNGLPNGVRIY